jgi:hypothetical protein
VSVPRTRGLHGLRVMKTLVLFTCFCSMVELDYEECIMAFTRHSCMLSKEQQNARVSMASRVHSLLTPHVVAGLLKGCCRTESSDV